MFSFFKKPFDGLSESKSTELAGAAISSSAGFANGLCLPLRQRHVNDAALFKTMFSETLIYSTSLILFAAKTTHSFDEPHRVHSITRCLSAGYRQLATILADRGPLTSQGLHGVTAEMLKETDEPRFGGRVYLYVEGAAEDLGMSTDSVDEVCRFLGLNPRAATSDKAMLATVVFSMGIASALARAFPQNDDEGGMEGILAATFDAAKQLRERVDKQAKVIMRE